MISNDIEMVCEKVLFRGIEKDSLRTMLDEFRLDAKTYEKGETIVHQGDMAKTIGVVAEGTIMCSKYHYDGTMQLLQVLGRGELLGIDAIFSSFHTSPYMAVANSLCIVAFFPYPNVLDSDYVDNATKITLLKNMLNIMADDNIRKMYKIDVLSKRTLRERIISFLSIIGEKRGSNEIDIRMNQAQFANYLCVNRSVLSKELNKMKREKVIDFQGSKYQIVEKI